MAKWVYMFTEGNATMRNLLGGKGANLADARVSTTSSFKPRFRIVSIIPGIEALAPERTETRRGFSLSPNFFPVISSNFTRASMI